MRLPGASACYSSATTTSTCVPSWPPPASSGRSCSTPARLSSSARAAAPHPADGRQPCTATSTLSRAPTERHRNVSVELTRAARPWTCSGVAGERSDASSSSSPIASSSAAAAPRRLRPRRRRRTRPDPARHGHHGPEPSSVAKAAATGERWVLRRLRASQGPCYAAGRWPPRDERYSSEVIVCRILAGAARAVRERDAELVGVRRGPRLPARKQDA